LGLAAISAVAAAAGADRLGDLTALTGGYSAAFTGAAALAAAGAVLAAVTLRTPPSAPPALPADDVAYATQN
ncbi:MAG TPA: hypothetical protein VL738_36235, partial [Dactylosporangium sp.]|nr:hypothetical protein [Dactylosporangium sp.]